ncbi:hypothetical protein Dimus_015276 [Dionaea muscipula]
MDIQWATMKQTVPKPRNQEDKDKASVLTGHADYRISPVQEKAREKVLCVAFFSLHPVSLIATRKSFEFHQNPDPAESKEEKKRSAAAGELVVVDGGSRSSRTLLRRNGELWDGVPPAPGTSSTTLILIRNGHSTITYANSI